ncbi:protein CHUP1, chloroplastic-like isoform X1 [Mangifera indica]|uniref:protein CHUP1, chloroplastic-like isoform X1 n=1 Tax=Mangifera indica TaxID=29780 RepID=UPI001CFC08B6|nr:protein CHUP1, chloroplastic-like isoform X1 [Mangifera indica]XP_044466161.1 protein CHUP1, chloroplastic-like isoform X1 [Mangifera indica]
MIFSRLSFFVVASVTALAVSQINFTDSSRKTKSSNIKHSEKNGTSFKQTEEEEEEKIKDNLSQDEKAEKEEEVERVIWKVKTHILMKELEKRKMVLERKSLELYGLKEQQAYIAQMQGQLEDKMTEINMLGGTANTLCSEIKNLREEMKQNILPKLQLEGDKKMVEDFEKKMNVNASQMKPQLVMLEEQVSEFQCNNGNHKNKDIIAKKLKAAKRTKLEYVEMQRINKELELEKRELTIKLVGAQARITSLSNMTQEKILGKIEEEVRILRHNNEDLSKEVEKLQRNKFNMVEELVYQKWLNACLRFETQQHQTASRRASCDLNTYATHKAEKEAKQLVLDLSFDMSSSPTSSSNESNEIDSSTSTKSPSSSNSQRSINNKKSGFVHSIKAWGIRRSKDDSGNCLIRRHSISMVPSNRPKMVQDSTESPDMLNLPRVSRVSFCDSVENLIPDAPKSVEEVTDDKEMCAEKSEPSSTTIDAIASTIGEATLVGSSNVSSLESIRTDSLNTEIGRRIEKSSDFGGENQVDKSIVHLVAVFLLFLFMLLVYLVLVNAGIY